MPRVGYVEAILIDAESKVNMALIRKDSVLSRQSEIDGRPEGLIALFTSDGPWRLPLKAGTLIEDDLFVTKKLRLVKLRTTFHRCREFL